MDFFEQPLQEEDLKLFIGPNAGAFLKGSSPRDRLGYGWVGVCWAGFLFPVPWFLYRKMYLMAAFTTVFPLAIGLIFPSPALSNTFVVAVSLAGGLGRRFYLQSARETIGEIRARSLGEEEARAEIARAGGVSWPGAAIGALIVLTGVIGVLVRIHLA